MSSQATQQQPASASEVGGLFDRLKTASTLSFFETVRSTPDSIHAFIEQCVSCLQIGKSNKWSESEIKSAAFICATQMLAEGLTFAELRQKYHIYVDKLDLRAEWCHAEIERLGWDWKWETKSDDAGKATLVATKGGKTCEFSYTLEMAKKAGLVKEHSGWLKNFSAQCRAAAVRGFCTMYVPSIKAGTSEDTGYTGSVELTDDLPTIGTLKSAKPAASEPAIEVNDLVVRSTVSPPAKNVTLESMTSAIEFSPQAFEAFAIAPKISTIGMLCQFNREQLEGRVASLKGVGKKKAEKIVTDVCIKLGERGFDLKPSSPVVEQSGGDSSADAESAKPEARTDASALAARGKELAADSDANHGDNLHGATLAEIREFFTVDPPSKAYAKETVSAKCGGKTSLTDCTIVESLIVLLYLLGRKAGVESAKIDPRVAAIHAHATPVDEAARLCQVMRDRIAASGK